MLLTKNLFGLSYGKLTDSCFNKQEDIRTFFENQLKWCGVDYFDFYLIVLRVRGITRSSRHAGLMKPRSFSGLRK